MSGPAKAIAERIVMDRVHDAQNDVQGGRKNSGAIAIPAEAFHMLLQLSRSSIDPLSEKDVVELSVDLSYDGGQHWHSTHADHPMTGHISWRLNGGQRTNRYGEQVLSEAAGVPLRFVGSASRLARLITNTPKVFLLSWSLSTARVDKS